MNAQTDVSFLPWLRIGVALVLAAIWCAHSSLAAAPGTARQAMSPYDQCLSVERPTSHFFVGDICFFAESKYKNLLVRPPPKGSTTKAFPSIASIKGALGNYGQVMERPGGFAVKVPSYPQIAGSVTLPVDVAVNKIRELTDSEPEHGPDDYVIHAASPPRPKDAADLKRQILVHTSDGNTFDLEKNHWLYTSEERQLVGITVAELAENRRCTVPSSEANNPEVGPATATIETVSSACSYSFVLVRPKAPPPSDLTLPRVFVGFVQVPQNELGPDKEQMPVGLEVTNDLWQLIYHSQAESASDVRFTLNGVTLQRIPCGNAEEVRDALQLKVECGPHNDPPSHPGYPTPFIIPPATDGWRVEVFPHQPPMCRRFPKSLKAEFVDIPRPTPLLGLERANGIVVGPVKIFDVLALRKMLSDTANQLTALVGFNAAAITGALTNIQGLSRDTSFFNAQVATIPSNAISATTGSTNGSTNQTVSTIPSLTTPSTTTTTVRLQCPDGTVPSLATSGAQGCVSSTNAPASTVNLTNTQTTAAAPSTQTTNGNTSQQQSGTTTTTPSVSGQSFIPATAASTAFTPPTNIGLSSADILTDQVNLNAQITTLRLLLQGALSDQYLIKGGTAVASRQQTTIGFTVSLDPPRQYKNAVAEVRVVISAPVGEDGISIMNLLPSEKTYNVAKVTSRATSFGAGVVTTPIGLGVGTGRARDRLYLAKDTDTLALQFPSPDSTGIGRPFPVAAGDVTGSAAHMDWRSDCDDDQTSHLPSQGQIDEGESTSVVFGWQFRPVLGESYVKGGQRQVFAQLALPASQNQHYVPRVHIQTRWRAYDPKRQVVGATYHRTCSWTEDDNGVIVLTNPSVDDVRVSDLGGGQLRLVAQGEFFSSGANIVAGTSTYSPTAFDGRSIQFIGRATDLMQADELTIVGPNGQRSDFGIPVEDGKLEHCDVHSATMTALPYPDGNSRVTLHMVLGGDYLYDRDADPHIPSDGKPEPLVMIGSQVYGLKETPFSSVRLELKPKQFPDPATYEDRIGCGRRDQGDPGGPIECDYGFIAPTTDIRNAQTFLVRDLAWTRMRYTGPIHFLPSVTELARITPAKEKDTSDPSVPITPAGHAASPPAGPAQSPKAGLNPPPAGKHPGKSTAPPDPVDFSVKGYDLEKASQCEPTRLKTNKLSPDPTWLQDDALIPVSEKLCVHVADAQFEWHVLSSTAAIVRVSAQQAKAASLRLHLYPKRDPADWTQHVVWELPVPKQADSSGTAAIAAVQMHRGDGGLITFKRTSFKVAHSVTFDGVALDVSWDPKKPTELGVLIPSSMTKIGGHKELKATAPGSGKATMLPIDVLN